MYYSFTKQKKLYTFTEVGRIAGLLSIKTASQTSEANYQLSILHYQLKNLFLEELSRMTVRMERYTHFPHQRF